MGIFDRFQNRDNRFQNRNNRFQDRMENRDAKRDRFSNFREKLGRGIGRIAGPGSQYSLNPSTPQVDQGMMAPAVMPREDVMAPAVMPREDVMSPAVMPRENVMPQQAQMQAAQAMAQQAQMQQAQMQQYQSQNPQIQGLFDLIGIGGQQAQMQLNNPPAGGLAGVAPGAPNNLPPGLIAMMQQNRPQAPSGEGWQNYGFEGQMKNANTGEIWDPMRGMVNQGMDPATLQQYQSQNPSLQYLSDLFGMRPQTGLGAIGAGIGGLQGGYANAMPQPQAATQMQAQQAQMQAQQAQMQAQPAYGVGQQAPQFPSFGNQQPSVFGNLSNTVGNIQQAQPLGSTPMQSQAQTTAPMSSAMGAAAGGLF